MDSSIVQIKLQEYLGTPAPGGRQALLHGGFPGTPEEHHEFLRHLISLEKDANLLMELFDRLTRVEEVLQPVTGGSCASPGADATAVVPETHVGSAASTLPAVARPTPPTGVAPAPAGRPGDASWADGILERLVGESSPDHRLRFARLLGRPGTDGRVPLEAVLERLGPTGLTGRAEALARDPGPCEVFVELFAGLVDPNRRTLATLLEEMAQARPGGVEAVIREALFARDSASQRVGLLALLEIPEELAVRILSDFPEELTTPGAQAQIQEVQATFELRRYLRRVGVAYFPLRCLGGGGMGEVYLSEDLKRPPRLGALKFLRPPAGGSLDPDLLARFQREARVPLLLNHPGIVRVFDYGDAGEYQWIDIDYVRGESLQACLDRVGTLPWEEALWIFEQLVETLDYLHRNRVIHRDLKPSNVFLGFDPRRALIGDFGLVQLEDLQLQKKVPDYAPTSAQLILGSVGYMAPEQALGGTTDHRSDLFSLGVLLYQVLQGRLPFPGRDLSEYVMSLTRTRPAPLEDPTIPAPLASMILGLLAESPEERPATAGELGGILENASREPRPDRSAPVPLRVPGPDPAGVPEGAGARPAAVPDAGPRVAETLAGAPPPPVVQTLVETVDPATDPDLDGEPGEAALDPAPAPGERPGRPAVTSEFLVGHEEAEEAPKGTRMVCKGCGQWFDGRNRLKAHQEFCKELKKPRPGKTALGRQKTPAGKTGPDGSGPLVCSRCKREYTSAADGCWSCRLQSLPSIPWLVAWIQMIGGLALAFVLPGREMLEMPVPVPPAWDQALLGIGLATFWTGRCTRRSQNWAYTLTLVGLLGISIGAGLQLALRQTGSDLVLIPIPAHPAGVMVGALASLIMGLLLANSRSWNHFQSNWNMSQIASTALTLGLLFGGIWSMPIA